MNNSKLIAWIEIATAVSVFVGLMFVAMELRQSNEHASAQSIQEVYQFWQDVYEYESQYEIDLLIEKAIDQPEQLTNAELYRLDDYHSKVLSAFMIRELMEELGLNPLREVANQAQTIVSEFFYYPVARSWLIMEIDWVDTEAPAFSKALQEAMRDTPLTETDHWIDSWRSDFLTEEPN